MRKLIIVNLIGNAIGLVAGVVLAVMLTQTIRNASTTLDEVNQFSAVQQHAADIRLQMIAMSDAMRGYLLDTSNQAEAQKKTLADEALVQAVAALRASTTNPRFIALATEIGELDESSLDRIEDSVLERAATDAAAATRSYFVDYMPVRARQMAMVEQLQTLASDGYVDKMKTVQAESNAAIRRLVWLAGAALLLMVAAATWSMWTAVQVRRRLDTETTTLTNAADEVLRAAQDVSGASQSLSQGVVEQAASIEETSASMKDVADMTRQNADSAQAAAAVMGKVESGVRGSNLALEGMVTAMGTIQDSSRRVAKIVKTIDEIAFQTNILALNAAVEAARAGESGLGFAVVADEVRNLAQRSAAAARDTAELIEASMATTAGGNERLAQVSSAIKSITDSVTTVRELVDTMSRASVHQAQGTAQVAQALSQMEKVTHTTAATAEESAASSEALTAQARSARQVAARLNELIGRPDQTPPPQQLQERAQPQARAAA